MNFEMDLKKHLHTKLLIGSTLDSTKTTVFWLNPNMLKNQDSSNPIFYINYAHARINQVFVKVGMTQKDIENVSFEKLNQDGLNLVYESLLLGSILNEAFIKRDMQKITEYLYNLASSIHKFYNEHKVIGSDEQNVYLKVLSMAALSINVGLSLLGIKAREIM